MDIVIENKIQKNYTVKYLRVDFINSIVSIWK